MARSAFLKSTSSVVAQKCCRKRSLIALLSPSLAAATRWQQSTNTALLKRFLIFPLVVAPSWSLWKARSCRRSWHWKKRRRSKQGPLTPALSLWMGRGRICRWLWSPSPRLRGEGWGEGSAANDKEVVCERKMVDRKEHT